MCKLIDEECGLSREGMVVVGVSGGPDSLCLLHLLHTLGYGVLAAHFDHMLRDESGAEAERVRVVAGVMGVPFILGRGDVGALANREKMSIEEAARTARYRFLFQVCQDEKAAAVAVAHTADDQVETVLMHLLRGAGLSGLKGMASRTKLPEWDAEIPLVRPLLGVWRAEVLAYCAENGLEPTFDSSNEDIAFFRNRLRHELIPILEQYNPRVKEALWRTARTVEGDHAVLEKMVTETWEMCCEGRGRGYILLRRAGLVSLARGMKRSIFRRTVGMLRPNLRDIDFSVVERAVDFCEQPSRSGRMELAAGLRMELEGEYIRVLEEGVFTTGVEYPQLPMGGELVLKIPGDVQLEGGWRLESRLIGGGAIVPVDEPGAGWLDVEQIEPFLTVRARREGDRFQAFGLGGHTQKLSDFFINEHLPKWARAGYPLVCSGEKIAWIPGYRPAEFCALGEDTWQVVVIRLVRDKDWD